MKKPLAADHSRELIDRIRSLLPDLDPREVRMFGVLALMVNDAMMVAVHKDGSLLARVDPAEDAELLLQPEASRAEMGTGRSMGEGWIRVGAEALGSDVALSGWLDAAARRPRPTEPHTALGKAQPLSFRGVAQSSRSPSTSR